MSLQTIVRKYLGRKANVSAFIGNAVAVDTGIKPAYLVDEGNLSMPNLLKMLDALYSNKLVQNQLKVIELERDLLIVNVAELETVVSSNRLPVFIDVSKALGKPELLLDGTIISGVQSELENIAGTLKSGRDPSLTYGCKQECNITSLFGCLLNYPVSYWYNTSNGDCENCLACVDLTVVKVHAMLDAQLYTDSPFTHSLYQFSFPTILEKQCKPVVSVWLQKTEERINQSHLFRNPAISITQENLNAVMM